MFASNYSAPGSSHTHAKMSSLNKSNIKEANDHLKQLNQRVYELETQLQLQRMNVEDLQRLNGQLKKEVVDLKKQVAEKDEQVQVLLSSAEERDKLLNKLELKTRLFYEVAEHKTALVRILQVLDEVTQDHPSHDTMELPQDTAKLPHDSSDSSHDEQLSSSSEHSLGNSNAGFIDTSQDITANNMNVGFPLT